MSLDTFRNNILSNSGEGRVEVNQRDLIYKILARYVVNPCNVVCLSLFNKKKFFFSLFRYSCKFVIFRELMQNSGNNFYLIPPCIFDL
jgi:hypothetical protein